MPHTPCGRGGLRQFSSSPLDRDEKMFGTICHFDCKPGRIADLDVELLEYMAALLRSVGENWSLESSS
ncbi:MAG: hypothetical protein ABIV39_11250 [Verrucomicrobiota bacterium]